MLHGSIAADIRCAVRALWARPAFSVLSVLILGLGIGANAAISAPSSTRGGTIPLTLERLSGDATRQTVTRWFVELGAEAPPWPARRKSMRGVADCGLVA